MARRMAVVLLILTLVTIVAFVLVSRLVSRFQANEKAIARHVFAHGMQLYLAGNSNSALDDFRTALSYDPGNFEYELNLARALRDSGRLPEAAAYLTTLWTRNPEDGVINLALARLAVRRSNVDDALRYYHNAIYGAWAKDADENRRNTRLELIDFLIKEKAFSIAQAETLTLLQNQPNRPENVLQAADLLMKESANQDALEAYSRVMKSDPNSPKAWAGAGQAAFQMGRYRTAEQYLTKAVELDHSDAASRQSLEIARLVLERDPFLRRISDAERNRRVVAAFETAGDRLRTCMATPQAVNNAELAALQDRWQALRPQLKNMGKQVESDMPDTVMDLVFQIERQTERVCGASTGADLALTLIDRDRRTVDQ